MRLGEAVRLAGKRAQQMKQEGSAATFTGLAGMLALQSDSIRRWFDGDQDPDEVLHLSANAILCFQVALEQMAVELPQGMPEPDLVPPAESYSVEDDAPTLGPVPFEYQGWQTHQEKAADFEEHLRDAGKWDLLTVQQQEGIMSAAQGQVDDPSLLEAQSE